MYFDLSYKFDLKQIPKNTKVCVFSIIALPTESIPLINLPQINLENLDSQSKTSSEEKLIVLKKIVLDLRSVDFTRNNIKKLLRDIRLNKIVPKDKNTSLSHKKKHYDIISLLINPVQIPVIKNYDFDLIEFDLNEILKIKPKELNSILNNKAESQLNRSDKYSVYNQNKSIVNEIKNYYTGKFLDIKISDSFNFKRNMLFLKNFIDQSRIIFSTRANNAYELKDYNEILGIVKGFGYKKVRSCEDVLQEIAYNRYINNDNSKSKPETSVGVITDKINKNNEDVDVFKEYFVLRKLNSLFNIEK